MAKIKDAYVNIIAASIVESGASTLTFSEIDIGVSLFDRAGLLLQRVEFSPTDATLNLMSSASDRVDLAICSSNQITSLAPNQSQVICYDKIHQHSLSDVGFEILQIPFVHDYSGLIGGGLLVPPKPLYWGIQGSSIGSACTVNARMFFTFVELSDADYFELLETRRYYG